MIQYSTDAAAVAESGSVADAPTPSRPQADPHPLAAHASAAIPSFARLAQVEMQLVMHYCDKIALLRLARCSHTAFTAASHRFAWRSLPPLEVHCDAPLELSSRVSQSLLRHADISIRWIMRPATLAGHGAASAGGGEADQTAATEAAALAALPGLRRLDVICSPPHLALICDALLTRLDDGGALASLRFLLEDEEEQGEPGDFDCAPLGQLLARSRTLTDLRAQGNTPTTSRALMDGVRQSQSLTVLNLCGNDLGAEGANAVAAAVAHCRTLTDLQLAGCGINDAGAEALVEALERGEIGIRTLNLSGNRFRHVGAAAVARLLASDCCAVESLDLSYCDLLDLPAKALAKALRANRSLIRLRLDRCRLRAAGVSALVAALQDNSSMALRQLVLSNNRVAAADAAALAGFLRVNGALEELDLRVCGMDDAAVAALAAGLPAAGSLSELRLSQNAFGVVGATALAAGIQACPSLTWLDVDYNPALGDGGMAALAPALGHLRRLDVVECGLTGGSAASLASLLRSSRHLHTLHLYSNAIGAAGVTALALTLDSSTPLRSLNLCTCRVGVQSAAALGEALRRSWAVTNLQLGHNPHIGDDGARALASALEQCASGCSLRALGLDDCSLSSAGGRVLLRAALAVPSLRSLSLLRNRDIVSADKPALLAACGAQAHFTLAL